ncbi:MAG: two-component system response regulator BtsR [bacterium]
MIRTIIIDDELHAREELEYLITETHKFEIVDRCENGIEALKSIHKHRPDIIFLDIQMPVISGIELVGMIDDDFTPRVVFVTAYDDYALKAIEENAFDYLLKPVEKKRLEKCVARLEKDLLLKQPPAYHIPKINRIPCHCGRRIKLIDPKEIEYAFTDVAGVHIVTREKELFTGVTLKTIEQKTDLFRCHKQYLINLMQIDEIILLENGAAEVISKSDKRIPISRRYLKPLKEKLLL